MLFIKFSGNSTPVILKPGWFLPLPFPQWCLEMSGDNFDYGFVGVATGIACGQVRATAKCSKMHKTDPTNNKFPVQKCQ